SRCTSRLCMFGCEPFAEAPMSQVCFRERQRLPRGSLGESGTQSDKYPSGSVPNVPCNSNARPWCALFGYSIYRPNSGMLDFGSGICDNSEFFLIFVGTTTFCHAAWCE